MKQYSGRKDIIAPGIGREVASITRACSIVAVIGLAAVGCGAPDLPEATLRTMIEERASEARVNRSWVRAQLDTAYTVRDGEALWLGRSGLSRRGRRLLTELEGADREGLDPEAYGVSRVRQALAELDELGEGDADSAARAETLTEIEIRLSLGLLEYVRDLVRGRLDPDRARQDWEIEPEPLPPNPLLRVSEGESPDDLLDGLRPRAPYYGRLVRALAVLREVRERGGWPGVEIGPAPEIGEGRGSIRSLRARLRASEDERERELARVGGDTDVFDADLAGAVRRYQSRHGLEPDGVLGPATLRELNTPIDQRIQSIILNLDRLRWLPRDLGERAILVNVAGFEFELLEDHEPRMAMNVVVGRAEWATKLFRAEMDHLVLNPYWNVPRSIALNEVIPAAREDPQYLARNGFEVLGPEGSALGEEAGWQALLAAFPGEEAGNDESDEDEEPPAAGSEEPDSVPGAEPDLGDLRLRQAPGELNALGQVKFMFPNPYDIYLHDTPDDHLFSRSYRAFSHGCIRVERPLELAREIVERYADRPPSDVDRILESGETVTIELERKLDVYVVYLTAWVEEDGTIHFYRDIYDRDDVLRRMVS